MRPALISEVRVEKKPRFTSSALTRACSQSRQSIRLSRSKTRQETLDFLFSLFFLYKIKKMSKRVATRWKNGAKRGIFEEPGRNVEDERYERGTIRASMDWLYRRAAPPAGLGEVYSREIRLIIRLINWSASIRRALVVLDLIDRLRCTIHGLMFAGSNTSTHFTMLLDFRMS